MRPETAESCLAAGIAETMIAAGERYSVAVAAARYRVLDALRLIREDTQRLAEHLDVLVETVEVLFDTESATVPGRTRDGEQTAGTEGTVEESVEGLGDGPVVGVLGGLVDVETVARLRSERQVLVSTLAIAFADAHGPLWRDRIRGSVPRVASHGAEMAVDRLIGPV